MGVMLCAITALQHHITELAVDPELSQLLPNAGPMFELESHGAAHQDN
jgi:hypothetical protein